MARAGGIEAGDGFALPLPPLDECAGALPIPAHYRGHEELDVPRLEVSDDVGGEERPVEVEALEPDALALDEADEFLDDFELPVRTPDERQCDCHPSPREDGVGGRIGVEPGGA